ncbi:MAG: fabG [Verrucomicrobiales bacterium]|nr:fabG [Verrucomicrobiales bacterium]
MALVTQGQVVLITGASGGLGQVAIQSFKAAGWKVVAASRSPLETAPDDCVLPVPMDVTSKTSIESGVQEGLKKWGRIDCLINNAGLAKDNLLAQLDSDDWDGVLTVNLKGAFLCSQAVLRPMLKQRSGHIIHISSWSGRVGARGQANYAAAKAGLFGLTTSLAREVGSRNIRVNAVLPGVLPTKMTAHLGEARLKAYAEANVLGRINSLEEVGNFLASLASMQNVSGQIFQLDSRIGPWS